MTYRHPDNEKTWIAEERDGQRPGRVIFPDGKIRAIRLAGTADTFFTIPADDRRGTHGVVMSEHDGFHFTPFPDDEDPGEEAYREHQWT